MKTHFLIIGVLLAFMSCEDATENKTCAEDPLQNIAWLNELVTNETHTDNSNSTGLEIIQYEYEGATVFSVNDCVNNCSDAITVIYDCEQNILCEFGGIAGVNTCEDFYNEALNKNVLFTTRTDIIMEIMFQNSFGFCEGYCLKTMKLENQTAIFNFETWTGELDPITCSSALTSSTWNEIQDSAVVNQFFELEDVYGCPDCADGGASFLEIILADGSSKKVSFEYSNPPEEIAAFATMLQELLDASNSCEIEGGLCDKAVIVDVDLYENLGSTPIEEARVEGNCLYLTFLSTTQDLDDIWLIDSGAVLESFPVQRNVKLYVNQSTTEPAENTTTASFDISSLATWDEPRLTLNIEGLEGRVEYTRQALCGDPDSNCLLLQEEDTRRLSYLLSEIQFIASSVNCENATDWKYAPYGAKACGGSQGFIAYSTNINETTFLEKLEAYKNAEDAYNRRWGIASTCDVPAEPTSVICNNGVPEFLYN